MAQIAWFRGALWDRSKVELPTVAAAPLTGVRDRIERGELARDTSRAFYRYHQIFQREGRRATRKMTIGATRLEPWTEGTVRAHEAPDPAAREAAVRSITAERAHGTPVFAGYR